MTQDEVAELDERLAGACVGHPLAAIPWPHRVLHDARQALQAQQAEIERLRALDDGGMSAAAVHAIRELLTAQNVPVAAFIDDHVGNAIFQRNEAIARAEKAEAKLATPSRETAEGDGG